MKSVIVWRIFFVRGVEMAAGDMKFGKPKGGKKGGKKSGGSGAK